MKHLPLSKMTWVALFLVGAAILMAAPHAGASGGGGKPCTYGAIWYAQNDSYDSDYDGWDDSAVIAITLQPGFVEKVWINVTVYDTEGAIAGGISDYDYTDYTTNTYQSFEYNLAPWSLSGDYVLSVTSDYEAGACSWFDYHYTLYPIGDYQPAVAAAVVDRSGEQNSSLGFALNVTNLGNNPDSFGFNVIQDFAWSVLFDPLNPALDPGASTLVNVSVLIPTGIAPLTVDHFNISLSSARNGSRVAYIDLIARVNAQTFTAVVFADIESLEGPVGTQLNYTITAINQGNNRDTMQFIVPTPPTGWSAIPDTTSVTLWPDEQVTFNLAVRLPFSYTSVPRWDFQITLQAGDHLTNGTTTLHARLLLPDFVVAPAGITTNNSNPIVGQELSVQVNILNLGAPIAVTFAVSLTDGSGNHTVIIDMTSAGTTVASFSLTALFGTMHFDAFADSTYSVPEDNETNNHGTLALITNEPPVALPGNATASAHPGDAITISAAGSTDLDGSVAQYYFDFGDGTNTGWVSTASVAHTYNAAGNYTVSIRVRDDHGVESAPATEAVTIAPGSSNNNGGGGGGGGGGGSGEAGSLPVLPLVLLLAVAAAAGALVVMMRRKKPGTPAATSPPPAPPAEPPKAP